VLVTYAHSGASGRPATLPAPRASARRHRITLRFWPDGLAAGLGVFAAGLAACPVFLLAQLLRGRRQASIVTVEICTYGS
jgi:hypothetical protein